MRLAVLCAALLAGCGLGQPRAAPGDPVLDPLFAALLEAEGPAAAGPIEARIWAIWGSSGSATADVLMARAAAAQDKGRSDLARIYLDEVVRLSPDYAEAYARRAAVAFAEEDLEGALADLAAALDREPRHFGAMIGLGAIYERLGRKDAALKAYQDALALHPNLEEAKQGAARLAAEVAGEDI